MPDSSLELTDDEQELVSHLTEIEENEGAIRSAVPKLSSAALHAFCCVYNWDSDLAPLEIALDQPQCDRATALAIYWLSEPDAWAGLESAHGWQKETFDICKKAEQRLLADDFSHREISFDIREQIGGIDSYWDGIASNPDIPHELKPKWPRPKKIAMVETLFLDAKLERIDADGNAATFVFSNGTKISVDEYWPMFKRKYGAESPTPIYDAHPLIGSTVVSVSGPDSLDELSMWFDNRKQFSLRFGDKFSVSSP